MEDAERLRRMYLVAIAQHEVDVCQLNIAQHVRARRRWRRGQRNRKFWTRTWILRRRQFGLYDQLIVELRREDPGADLAIGGPGGRLPLRAWLCA